jgi:hypothetical protein
MDDDLRALVTLLARPAPSQDAVDRGRHRLQQAIRTPHRNRGIARSSGKIWLAGGAGLTATAAAGLAILTAAAPAVPAMTHGGHHLVARPATATGLSGRQVLLAAAVTAAGQSEGSGTYWYVRYTISNGSTTQFNEIWTRLDGSTWTAGSFDAPGTCRFLMVEPGFWVYDGWLTYSQLQKLPADATALLAWAAGLAQHTIDARAALPPGTLPAADHLPSKDRYIAGSLIQLLGTVPAPPAVRAAAFRAFASLPQVKSTGHVDGGQGVQVSFPESSGGDFTMVVNPSTSALLSSTSFKGSQVFTAGWTNTLPRVAAWP